jgi:hypothetical protein
MSNMVDDNFVIRWIKEQNVLITGMEKKLELIAKWIKQSRPKEKETKIVLCLFYKKDA